jgi:hypothetical protein
MMTREALLWRLKYFIVLVAIFMITSFAPPDCAADDAEVAAQEHASVEAP